MTTEANKYTTNFWSFFLGACYVMLRLDERDTLLGFSTRIFDCWTELSRVSNFRPTSNIV